jgi:hypothetical protein
MTIHTKRLRALAEAATQHEWVSTKFGYEQYVLTDERGIEIGFAHRGRDAAYIAAAMPQTMLTLLDRIERLENALATIADGEGDAQEIARQEIAISRAAVDAAAIKMLTEDK